MKEWHTIYDFFSDLRRRRLIALSSLLLVFQPQIRVVLQLSRHPSHCHHDLWAVYLLLRLFPTILSLHRTCTQIYADDRNNPNDPQALSNLSPWFRFGQVLYRSEVQNNGTMVLLGSVLCFLFFFCLYSLTRFERLCLYLCFFTGI